MPVALFCFTELGVSLGRNVGGAGTKFNCLHKSLVAIQRFSWLQLAAFVDPKQFVSECNCFWFEPYRVHFILGVVK